MKRLVMNDPADVLEGRCAWSRPYEAGDEDLVRARPDFRAALSARGALPEGPKWTLLAGVEVLAVGGVALVDGERWGGWAYAANLTPRQWRFGAAVAGALLDWFQRTHPTATLQVIAGPHPGAAPLLERVGLQTDARLGDWLLMTLKEAA